MDWTQTLTIIGSLGIVMFWFVSRIETDISRIDADFKVLGNRIDAQNQRIDQLYQMFVDLLKQQKG